jgi:hypothetical protein
MDAAVPRLTRKRGVPEEEDLQPGTNARVPHANQQSQHACHCINFVFHRS